MSDKKKSLISKTPVEIKNSTNSNTSSDNESDK